LYKNYRAPEEEGLKGKYMYFCSWKDGSLTDIKVLRDGYGTGKEAIEFYKSVQDGIWSAKW
jgi:hypothetical protein